MRMTGLTARIPSPSRDPFGIARDAGVKGQRCRYHLRSCAMICRRPLRSGILRLGVSCEPSSATAPAMRRCPAVARPCLDCSGRDERLRLPRRLWPVRVGERSSPGRCRATNIGVWRRLKRPSCIELHPSDTCRRKRPSYTLTVRATWFRPLLRSASSKLRRQILNAIALRSPLRPGSHTSGKDSPDARSASRDRRARRRLGRGQAVRRGTLDPVFEGSNPSAPANRAWRSLRRQETHRRPAARRFRHRIMR
jgi:hypothetical protein